MITAPTDPEIKTGGDYWSRALPEVEGFYWYREEGSEPEVIFWDHEMKWAMTTGSEIAMGADMACSIDGEFWSVRLSPPTD